MYSPYYRQARPPDQPGQQRRFNKIQFSGHTGTQARRESVLIQEAELKGFDTVLIQFGPKDQDEQGRGV
jgi:hypothetical protein